MHTALILIAMFACNSATAGADPEMLGILSDVYQRDAWRTDGTEVAVFIVRTPDGRLSCLLWPHTDSVRSAHYDGPIPPGTIALAHSHPIHSLERPSRGDVVQAQRIGLPIYVVTRWCLYVVDPLTGQSVELIQQKNWTRGNPRCSCSAFQTAGVSVAVRSGSRANHR